MRSTRGFTLLSAALAGLLFPPLAWGQPAALPGPGPIAPAPDVPHVSPVSPETLEPPPPRGYAEDILKAKRDAASVRGVAPGVVDLDRGATYGPGWLPPGGQPGASQDGGGGPLPSAPSLTSNFNGIDYSFSFPPDPVMAAGPTNLVLVVNGSVTIRNKTGGLVASTSLATFFSSVRVSGENAFDPRVVYDTGSSRFFLLAVGRISNSSCTPGTCVSHFFLGVSKTSSPATTGSADWFFYAFDATLDGATATTNWADYPDLGVDPTAVVLTANMFSFSSGSFQRAKIRILDKSVLIAGGAAGFTDFVGMTDPVTGFLSFTLRAALTFGSPGTFFLASASRTSGSCDIVVWGIANPLSAPTLTSRLASAGGTCNSPPDASQLGGGGFPLLDTGDQRLYNAVYRNSSLWAAQSISMNFGSGAVSAIRWVQVNVSSWPASASLTQDAVFGADGIFYFYPAVMVDAANNMGMVLARSSSSEFASAYYTGRLAADPANTLQPSALLKPGAAAQNLVDSIGRNRYGDYLGIGLDPSDGSFWVLGEYVVSTSAWGTWVGNFTFGGGSATLIAPVGSISTTTPTYTWSAVATADSYQLWVNDSSMSGKINQWLGPATVGCGAGTGTCSFTPGTSLAPGAATWWIRTWSAAFGYGQWSVSLNFTIALPAATLVSPTGTINTNRPTYTWNAVAQADSYQLWVNDSTGSGKIVQWIGPGTAGCGPGTGMCSFTPGTALAGGAATWWIQTWSTTLGYGPWSAPLNFTIAPPPATLVSPSGPIGTRTPTYTWNAVAEAASYQLWVNDSAMSGKINQWLGPATVGCGAGTGTCSFTPGTSLAPGAATWWIRTWSPSLGYGDWSAPLNLTVP